MRRHFGGQPADDRADDIGEQNDGEQRARNFTFGVARTRQEFLNEQCDNQKQGQNHSAEPQRYGRPMNLYACLSREVEKKQAGRYQDRPGQEESRAKYQGDAVLRALKANQRDGGKNEGEKASDNLEVALKGGVGINRYRPDPQGEQQNRQEGDDMPEGRGRTTASGFEIGFAHIVFLAGGRITYLIRPLNPAWSFAESGGV